jgi:hypothetical protein
VQPRASAPRPHYHGLVQATRTRRSAKVKITILAWIAILLLTGLFQFFFRGAIADGIVFVAVAAVLVVGETGILKRFDGWHWQPRRILVIIALVIAAAVLVFTPRHGLADGVVVVASGVALFIVAWPNPPVSESGPDAWSARLTRSAVAWAILGIAFCAWELTTYFLGLTATGRAEYPALSDLINPILNNPIGRLLGVAAWLAGGVALARRGRTTG